MYNITQLYPDRSQYIAGQTLPRGVALPTDPGLSYSDQELFFMVGVVFHGRLSSVEQLHTWHRLLSICTGVFFLVSVFVLVSPAGFLVWDELIHIKSIKCSGLGWYRYMYSMNCLRCDLLTNIFTGSATMATWI